MHLLMFLQKTWGELRQINMKVTEYQLKDLSN